MVCTHAHASFELALVADSSQRAIHRYDPETGAYLGKFGQGSLLSAANGVVADRSTGKAFVIDANSSALRMFNFNTGALLGSTSYAAAGAARLVIDTARGRIYGSSGNSIYSWDENLSFISSWSVSGAVFGGVDIVGNRLVANNMATQVFHTIDLAAGTLTLVASGNTLGAVSAMSSRELSSIFGICSIGTTIHVHDNFTRYSNSQVTSLASITGLASGHAERFYALGTSGGGGVALSRMIGNSILGNGGEVDVLALSNVTTASGLTVLLAPEPTSLAALSLGLVAFMRRRRR